MDLLQTKQAASPLVQSIHFEMHDFHQQISFFTATIL
jgi:hypothetical protein